MSEQWPDFDQPNRKSGFSLKKRIVYGLISLLIILGLVAPLSRPFLRNGLDYLQSAFRADPDASDPAMADEMLNDVSTVVPEPQPPDPTPTETSAELEPVTPPEPDTEAVVGRFPIDRIAYVTTGGDVATISPDGSDERILTSGDQFYQFPAWSPDGRYLAAIGAARGEVGIYLLEDSSDAEVRPLYSSRDKTPFYLYWSPNSQQISFLAQHDVSPMTLRLVDVNSEDGDESDVVLEGGPLYWVWAADGESFFVHSALSDDERMGFMSASGEMMNENIAAPGAFQAPSISPSGRFLAYAQRNAGGFDEIVVADIETTTEERSRYNGVVAMGWSPAGDDLAYISNATTEGFSSIGPLRLYSAEAGDTTLLSEQNVIAFFWSPDGRYIAYYTLTNPAGDTEFNASWPPRSEKSALTAKEMLQRRPAFDLTVVDTTSGMGRVLLTDIELSALFITQFLPFFDQYAMSHTLWSPGSDAFLVPFNDSGRPRIAVVSVEGGQVRELAEGFVAFWSHQ